MNSHSKIVFSIVRTGGLPIGPSLLQWFSSIMNRPPLPIFRLQNPQKPLEDETFDFSVLGSSVQRHRRSDSGILEFQLFDSNLEDFSSVQTLERLVVFAQKQFDRSFSPTPVPESQITLAQMNSRFMAGDTEEQVVGPGGRITLYRGPNSIEADVVVRERIDQIDARWRSPEHITARFFAELGREPQGIQVIAQFGYLELSKYEAQEWLRPVFLFSFQNLNVEQGHVAWEYSFVEPATTNLKLGLHEGLGSWNEGLVSPEENTYE